MANTTDIYARHKADFKNVSAYVVMRGADLVATIAFKYSNDGDARLYAYVHWIGSEMVRGHATGYGKRSAACASAAKKLPRIVCCPTTWAPTTAFRDALMKNDGSWDRQLRAAGFEVFSAV